MTEKETKKCPFCGEEILAVAIKCKHCGEFLDSKNVNALRINLDTNKVLIVIAWVFGVLILIGLLGSLLSNNTSDTISKENTQISSDIQEETDEEEAEATEEAPVYKDCFLRVGKTCYQKPFKIKYSEVMTFMECMNEGGKYGIKSCSGPDAWGGVVKICGGVDNLPKFDDIAALAEYMYGVKMEKCPSYNDENASYLDVVTCVEKFSKDYPVNEDLPFAQWIKNTLYPYPPNDSYEYEQQKNWYFPIWTGDEENDHVYVAFLGGQGITRQYKGKYTDEYWGMCVSRD